MAKPRRISAFSFFFLQRALRRMECQSVLSSSLPLFLSSSEEALWLDDAPAVFLGRRLDRGPAIETTRVYRHLLSADHIPGYRRTQIYPCLTQTRERLPFLLLLLLFLGLRQSLLTQSRPSFRELQASSLSLLLVFLSLLLFLLLSFFSFFSSSVQDE